MNCADIENLSPLWHSGELDTTRQKEFDAHIAACPECAAEIREQWTGDARLREAMAAESVAETSVRAVERRVMRRIARERVRRWLAPAISAAAAAALVGAVLFWAASRHAAPIPAVFAPTLADAARDHTVEIINQAPRRWRSDPAEIAALETAQGISGSDVKALETTGYHLERAKVCRLGGTPYMHLVYAKAGREFSVFMKARGAQPVPETASTTGNLQLASFARGRVQAVIVTDAPRGECAKFTRDAEAAL
jgi:anti-sigma factor RsiW